MDNSEVDGVFASSDVIGAYVLQACADLGIKVPERLKLVGFDDVNIAQFTSRVLRRFISLWSRWQR